MGGQPTIREGGLNPAGLCLLCASGLFANGIFEFAVGGFVTGVDLL